MLLVYGDLTRNVWYFTFAVYSLARGTVKSESRFCQASGFFIQYGAETSGACEHRSPCSSPLTSDQTMPSSLWQCIVLCRSFALHRKETLTDCTSIDTTSTAVFCFFPG
jgi:hypothetical protein